MTGWFEEYACGCVSPTVPTRKELPGYCPRHGESRRGLFREGKSHAGQISRSRPTPRRERRRMTMRVTITNADESGRVLVVRTEDRAEHDVAWKATEEVTLAKGQGQNFYVHAARRLVLTERPHA